VDDVVVIGAGVIGLGVAWRCAQRGLAVTVVDPAPGEGASWTAAGMLAPITELHHGEAPLLMLALDSAARYPAFAAELTELTGIDPGYLRSGTVVAAWDAADLAALHDLRDYAATLGHRFDAVTGRELRRLVPGLAPGLPGGLIAPGDHQVDNRRLHRALLAAAGRCGTRLVARRAAELLVRADRAAGVRLEGGERIEAATVVLAGGAWSGGLAGVPGPARPPVRPVKGQTLRLRVDPRDGPLPGRIVRGSVAGSPVYLVPRADGELVVGASSQEAGFDVRPRAGAVYELLRDAQALLPALGEAELVEISTGLRPGSPDNAPIVGPTALPGLLAATGHYRNGILLTPVTADALAELITTGRLAEVMAPFTPARFAPAVVG
jgi:glycine oxidase